MADAQVSKREGGHAEVRMPEQIGEYNDHAQALEGELIPSMKPIAIPDSFEFEKTERGRMMHTKRNHQAKIQWLINPYEGGGYTVLWTQLLVKSEDK